MVMRSLPCGSLEQPSPESFITRELPPPPPESRHIDLGQIVRQTIQAPADGSEAPPPSYVLQNDISNMGPQTTQTSDNQVYSLPQYPVQSIPTASAEAAEAAVAASNLTPSSESSICTVQSVQSMSQASMTTLVPVSSSTAVSSPQDTAVVSIPNVEPITDPESPVERSDSKVVVEDTNTIQIEGMDLIATTEVASTVTVISDETSGELQSSPVSEPSPDSGLEQQSSHPATCAEAAAAALKTDNGIKEIGFSLF